MIIKVSSDLKKQEIFANGNELANIMGFDRLNGKRVLTFPLSKKVYVHTFYNPILMTDNYRISKLNPTLRDTLFSLYSVKPRIVEFDGVSVSWNQTHLGVWCPSIDTLLFAKALKKLFIKNKNFYAGVEIGCGSGYLSKYALEKNKKIKTFLINDLNPYSIRCAKDNIKDKRAKFIVGDGLKEIENKKFDFMICNPPYVPRKSSIDDNPYEGIGLLNYLVHRGQNHLNPGGVLILNISSLCWDRVMKKKPSMKFKVLERMQVPLKVNNILNNKYWLEFLRKNGLKKELKQGYEYWQTLYIVAFENN